MRLWMKMKGSCWVRRVMRRYDYLELGMVEEIRDELVPGGFGKINRLSVGH